MGAEFCPRGPFKQLLNDFWNRLSNIPRLYKEGNCSKPAEWDDCLKDLLELIELRNKIVHADSCEILSFLSGADPPLKKAHKYYNSVVDAMMLINRGTGYETRPDEEAKKDFELLRVADK